MDRRALAQQAVKRAVANAEVVLGTVDGLLSAIGRPQAVAARTGKISLADLERQLGDLERDEASVRTQADADARLATDWEMKAMLAVRKERDDLARDALRHVEEHVKAKDVLAAEADVIAGIVAEYRRAIALMKSADSPG